MKYKKGDRVKIKSLDWYNENKDQHGRVACGYHVFTEDMSKFCGYTMIVCNRTNLGVMTMGGSASYWTDEMIECLADEPQEKMVSLDKVCEWLENKCENKREYISGLFGGPCSINIIFENISKDLRKAMEE